ncbi:MAG TPA: hypothetical protein PKE45_14055, partial [Caldilineaceae bacterium]|nr:hypothetical protein [Caldilineaceae bacterium]
MKVALWIVLFVLIITGASLAQPAWSQGDPCSGVSDVPYSQCSALVALYQATNGAGWVNRTNWLANSQVCTWFGVTCVGGSVTQLRLQSNGLSGTIPATLADLTALNWLELQYNQLTGTIPPQLGTLSALTELALYGNTLTGTIPPELGALSNLNALRLGFNNLSGSLPVALAQLNKLTILGVNNNQLTGTIPPDLGSLVKLTLINADKNQLTGPIPATFNNFPDMWRLYLENNRLSGELPAGLSNLSKLRVFSIRNNQFGGAIPSSYTSLTALTQLDIGYNKLSATGSTLVSFLNSKDADWAATQTVAPGNVQALALSGSSVKVTWTPIAYTGDGGYYEIGVATSAVGPFPSAGATANKSV